LAVAATIKQKNIRSKKHLSFIASLPCVFGNGYQCGGDICAAHIRIGTNGGTALKPSDDFTVPLCFNHHQLQHSFGERKFWGSADDKARRLAQELYKISGSRELGAAIIMGWLI
jgi:hypothetical protein